MLRRSGPSGTRLGRARETAPSHAILLVLGLAAACGGTGAPSDPRTWIPADALLVGEIDVATLGRAAFVKKLLRSNAASGVRAWEETCGVDVLSRVRKVAFVVPKAEDASEIGVVASGRLEEAALVACARRRARDRGSSLGTRREGDVVLHFDRDATGGALGFPAPGLVLGGTRRALAQMIAAASGEGERMAETSEHFRLRDRIGRDRQAWIAARIPESIRRRWREGTDPDLRPFLDIGWIVVGVRVWDGVQVSAILRAKDVRAAELLERVFRGLLDRGRREPAFALSPFGPVFARAIVSREGQEVVASVTLSERQIGAMAERIDDLERALGQGEAPSVPPAVAP